MHVICAFFQSVTFYGQLIQHAWLLQYVWVQRQERRTKSGDVNICIFYINRKLYMLPIYLNDIGWYFNLVAQLLFSIIFQALFNDNVLFAFANFIIYAHWEML